jgi:hypothetical protein
VLLRSGSWHDRADTFSEQQLTRAKKRHGNIIAFKETGMVCGRWF